MPGPLTDTERARILELHAQGLPRNTIAREVGRSAGTVTNVVKDAGLTFERAPEVQAATAAKQIDNAARRADAVRRLYDQVDYLLDRLEADTFKATADNFGAVVVTAVPRDATPPADVRSLGSTVANMLHTAAKLEQVDANKADMTGAASVIVNLGAQIRDLVGDYPGNQPDPDNEAGE